MKFLRNLLLTGLLNAGCFNLDYGSPPPQKQQADVSSIDADVNYDVRNEEQLPDVNHYNVEVANPRDAGANDVYPVLDSELDSRVNDAGRILTPYQPDENCLLLMHFDNGSLEDLCSIPGTSNFSAVGYPTYIEEGRFDGTYEYDGNSYFVRGRGGVFDNWLSNLTIEAYIKPAGERNGLGTGNPDLGDIGIIIQHFWESNGFGLYVSPTGLTGIIGAGGSRNYIDAEFIFPQDRYTHVALTYTSENGMIKLFINGREAKQENLRNAGNLIPPIMVSEQERTYIGGWQNINSFIGSIDELRISNIAREF